MRQSSSRVVSVQVSQPLLLVFERAAAAASFQHKVETSEIPVVMGYGKSRLLSRIIRSVPEDETKAAQLLGITLRKGRCSPGICGEEAACFPGENFTHRCVCPSDLSAPTPDLHCPFRRTVPVSGRPFPVSIGTIEKTRSTGAMSVFILSTFSALVLLFLGFLLYYFFRNATLLNRCCGKPQHRLRSSRSCGSGEGISLVRLTRGAIQNFFPNPEYSDEPLPLAVLSKDTLLFKESIGQGYFGTVYRGERVHEDGSREDVAIKVLKNSVTAEAEEDLMREVAIMNTFQHKNILKVIGVTSLDVKDHPWMVFEYMPFGDLAEMLRRSNQTHEKLPSNVSPLSKADLHYFALQIAAGMNYLNSRKFVHNDLASRNILIGENSVVKIADFGLSRDVYECDYYRIGKSKPLPLRWMSPESLMYRKFTLESDVWSYGVVLWEIYTLGKQPYYGCNNQAAMKLILRGSHLKPPPNCPFYIRDLMHACWRLELASRIKFNQIYSTLYKLHKMRIDKYPHRYPHAPPVDPPDDAPDDAPDDPHKPFPEDFPGTPQDEFGPYNPDRKPLLPSTEALEDIRSLSSLDDDDSTHKSSKPRLMSPQSSVDTDSDGGPRMAPVTVHKHQDDDPYDPQPTRLPRPPPFPVLLNPSRTHHPEDYLLPRAITLSEYLHPLAD